jgi:hypothetical protein
MIVKRILCLVVDHNDILSKRNNQGSCQLPRLLIQMLMLNLILLPWGISLHPGWWLLMHLRRLSALPILLPGLKGHQTRLQLQMMVMGLSLFLCHLLLWSQNMSDKANHGMLTVVSRMNQRLLQSRPQILGHGSRMQHMIYGQALKLMALPYPEIY